MGVRGGWEKVYLIVVSIRDCFFQVILSCFYEDEDEMNQTLVVKITDIFVCLV